MYKVIAFAGKKKSGKNTLGNFLVGYQLRSQEIVTDFALDPDGKLIVDFNNEDGKNTTGLIDLTRRDMDFQLQAAQSIWPFAKTYAYADVLKDMCATLFEVPHELLYGTDEQKNLVLEHMLWQNMPGVITPQKFNEFITKVRTPLNDAEPTWASLLDPAGPQNGKWNSAIDDLGIIVHEPGPMTIRDLLQYVGTDIFRKMWAPVWFKQVYDGIKNEESALSIVTDLRFDDEAFSLKQLGENFDVKIVQLTRGITNDKHSSEKGIDQKYVDLLLDNANMDLLTTCQELLKAIESWGWCK